jgi:hypothetical protein
MNEKLDELCEFLNNNNYPDDAARIKEIKVEINTNNRGIALKRLIAMCNPRYLGNIIIKEFSNAYEWWNFLGEISEEARDMLNNQ